MSQDTHEIGGSSEAAPQRIDTWKNIAAFFPCDESTARRWEKSYGMPVHRVNTDRGSGVYAFSDELQAWADEHLEMSAEGEAEARGLEHESAVEESGSDRSAKPDSDLSSKHGRLKVIAFSLIVIASSGYLLLKPHPHATSSDAGAGHQQQISQPAVNPAPSSTKNSNTVGPYVAQADQADQANISSLHDRSTKEIEQALQKFTDASQTGANDPQSFVGIAECENALAFRDHPHPAEAFVKAYQAANRAITLKPESAKARRELAIAELYGQWNGAGAITEFTKAVEFDPKDAELRQAYADGLLALGDIDEALKEITEAKRLDHTAVNIEADRAFLMANGTRRDEGAKALRSIVQAHPEALQPRRLLAYMLFDQQHIPEAMPVLDDIAKLSGERHDSIVAEAIRDGWNRGRTVGAFIALLKADQREYPKDKSVGPQMAFAALRINRKEEAVRYLREALENRYPQALVLANTVFSKELGNDADFASLKRSLPNPRQAMSDKN